MVAIAFQPEESLALLAVFVARMAAFAAFFEVAFGWVVFGGVYSYPVMAY